MIVHANLENTHDERGAIPVPTHEARGFNILVKCFP